jgi:hypothetical protein
VAAEERDITLIDLISGRTHPVSGPQKILDVFPHPSQPLLAVVHDGRLSIANAGGSKFQHSQALQLPTKNSRRPQPKFDTCYFDPSGGFLWSVARLSDDSVEIELRETGSWTIVASATANDPFGDSRCSLHVTSDPDVAALWLAAGQDGQQVIWVTRLGDSLNLEPEAYLENTSPPVFSPNGDEFLVVDGLWSICKFPFPAQRILGKCRSKWGQADYFGDSLSYLDDDNAVVQSHNGRLFRLDVRAMKIKEEIVIAGHEPLPVEEYYPTLAGDKTLCTDISYMDRFGTAVVLGIHREGGPDPRRWKDSLLIYDADTIARTQT